MPARIISLKYDTGHGLVDETVIIMFPISYKTCMSPQLAHFSQIFLHVLILCKQKIAEQAVDGKYRGDLREIMLYLRSCIFHDLFIVSHFQHNQNIGVV